MAVAETLVEFAQYYIWGGLAFAAFFLLWGMDQKDPAARGTYLFRIAILPGVVGLWPIVLWRWLTLARPEAGDGESRS